MYDACRVCVSVLFSPEADDILLKIAGANYQPRILLFHVRFFKEKTVKERVGLQLTSLARLPY